MKNFDYESAWFEVWLPAYKKLNARLRTYAERIANDSDVKQPTGQGGDYKRVVVNDKVKQYMEALEGYDEETLINFGNVCYHYGHHFPGQKALKAVGLNPPILAAGWRVQKVVYTLFDERDRFSTIGLQKKLDEMTNSEDYMASEALIDYRRKVRTHKVLHPDEPVPEWVEPDDEEGRMEWLNTKMPAGYGMRINGTHTFNHRLKDGVQPATFVHGNSRITDEEKRKHPFMITNKHMQGSSMYLDPSVAPCGICGCAYSDHTCDKAIKIDVSPMVDSDMLVVALQHVLKEAPVIKDRLIGWGYDGFVFPTNANVPAPTIDLAKLKPIHSDGVPKNG